MTYGLAGALLGGVAAVPLMGWLGSKVRLLAPLLPIGLGAGVGWALAIGLEHHPSARLLVDSAGSLGATRLELGVLAAAWGAMVLDHLMGHQHRLGGWGTAAAALVGLVATIALITNSIVVLALSLGAMGVIVWIRWQRCAGAILPMRSLGRQVAIAFAALLAAAVVLPSERLGSAPPAVVGMLLVGGLAGLSGLLPFSVWVGAASRLAPTESAVWRTWLIPVALLATARVLVASSPSLVEALEILLISLGICTAVFWAAAAARGDPGTRYLRSLNADVGLMFLAIASGTAEGLSAVLLLLLLHWIAGPLLSEPHGGSAQVLGWLGLSGVPPFGGFAARILVVISVGYLGPVIVSLVLLAVGLQLLAGALGLRDSATMSGPSQSPVLQLVGLLTGAGTLVLGLISGPALSFIFGVH